MENEYTAERVRAEVEKDKEEKLKELQNSSDIPDAHKTWDRFQHTWLAGRWLAEKLYAAGCDEELSQRIGYALGQRGLFGNPYKWAARYWTMYLQGQHEEPGEELANRINAEHMKFENGRIVISVEEI